MDPITQHLIYFNLLIIYACFTMGPAKVTIDKATECEDPASYPNRMQITVNKINDTFYLLNFDIDFKNNIDTNTSIIINLCRKFGEVYVPNIAILWKRDICKFAFKHANETLNNVLEQMERPRNCPVDAGSYKVKAISLNLSNLPKVLSYGEFRADVVWYQKRVKIFCQQIYATSDPRESKENNQKQ